MMLQASLLLITTVLLEVLVDGKEVERGNEGKKSGQVERGNGEKMMNRLGRRKEKLGRQTGEKMIRDERRRKRRKIRWGEKGG
jgi:hypothetical protein